MACAQGGSGIPDQQRWNGPTTFEILALLGKPVGENTPVVIAPWSAPIAAKAQGEARWLGGRSFGSAGVVNLKLAARVSVEDCPAGRVNLRAGFRPSKNRLAMGETFHDGPNESEESLKLQLSLVRPATVIAEFSAVFARGLTATMRPRSC